MKIVSALPSKEGVFLVLTNWYPVLSSRFFVGYAPETRGCEPSGRRATSPLSNNLDS